MEAVSKGGEDLEILLSSSKAEANVDLSGILGP